MARCETCEYFKSYPPIHHAFGTCRIKPPTTGLQRFPEVNRYEDFCGEHPEFRIVNQGGAAT